MAIQFFYFDLGKVLLEFTHERGFEQISVIAGIPVTQVRAALFDSGLSDRYETGEISTVEFHAEFCETAKVDVTLADLTLAWSDIFELNTRTMTVAASLRAAGHRLGILSNTCEAHWEFAAQKFVALNTYFGPVITSYDAKSMKPDAGIYEVAADRVGHSPNELFFVDDREENVEGANELGWNARLYTTALQLSNDLEDLGVEFNR